MITVKPHVLNHLLNKAALAVAQRSGDVLLTTFKVESKDGILSIMATDLSVGLITSTAAVETDGDESFCVPAKKFLRIIDTVPTGADITLELHTPTKLRIKAGQAVWETSVFEPTGYPELPEIKPNGSALAQVVRDDFLKALEKVRFAVSVDEARPQLQQVYFDGKRVYASDSYRMQVADCECKAGLSVPAQALADLVGLLKRSDRDTLRFVETANHIIFQIGQDTFSCSKFQAKFPDMKRIMLTPAQGNKHEVVVDRQALITAIGRVAIVADAGSKAVTLCVQDGYMNLRTSDQSGDVGTESIEADYDPKQEGRVVGLNFQYLLEMLGSLNEKLVTLRLGDDGGQRYSSVYVTEPGLEAVILQFRP